jgi:5'-nucleotidase
MVSTIGNHEFDKGTRELMRLIYGGNGATTITHLVDPYPQSRSTYVCSNVVWKANGTPILPPYTIRTVDDAKVAFIGADTITTPERQKYVNIENVKFLDEAGSINRYVTEVQQKGVHAIVVLLHEGGSQVAYDGRTRPVSNVTGRIVNIVSRLDGDVDIVLSGHTHQFSNAYLTNAGGKPVLVTQAYMFSKGYADVDIAIDRVSGDIVEKSARVVLAYADQPPGTTPDPEVSLFLAEDEKVIAPVTAQVIGVAARDITRNQNSAGESALGDLVADSQRAAMETDIAFITTGALRADIQKGNVTWSTLYTADPFSDTVVSVTLTGQQVREALERQWKEPLPPHKLGISGLSYTWDAAKPAGGRVVNVTVHGDPLDEMKEYSAAMVTYLVTGGDGYRVFTEGTGMMVGRADIDALNFYFGSLPQPVNVTIDGRIRRIN